MPIEFDNYVRLEALRAEFRREAMELLAIARRAGDTESAAIEWVTGDVRIGKLFDEITALKNAH